MRQPKAFFDFTKMALTCKFCPICFLFIRVNFVFPKHFLVTHTTSFRVAIFQTFFLTLLGLSHFNIRCIIIKIYFDLQIKRRSNPLLVLDIFGFRASIVHMYVYRSLYSVVLYRIQTNNMCCNMSLKNSQKVVHLNHK